MSNAFKKHLLFTFLSAFAFGSFAWAFKSFERGMFWFFISIIVNMVVWLSFGKSISNEDE